MMTTQIYRVVFEDNQLLVIEKLRPFLSQRGEEGSQEALFEFIARTKKISVYPVHRLDREVLGLMVFGKTPESADALSNQFRDRTIEKHYEATVKGRVSKDEDHLVHYLKKNSKNNHVTVYPRPTEGAKVAELEYKVLERMEGITRLKIILKTGRSHQIRVQLHKIGHPIVGDLRYGSIRSASDDERGEIRLKSVYLALDHPESGQRMNWSLSS